VSDVDEATVRPMLCAICSKPLGVIGIATPGVLCNEDEKWVHADCEDAQQTTTDQGRAMSDPNFCEAILSQDGEGKPFITLLTSGTPAGQPDDDLHGRSDYWSLTLDEAFKLGHELQGKAFEAKG
jgi:hypothetical protein